MPIRAAFIIFCFATSAEAQFLSAEIFDDGAIAPPVLRRLEKLEQEIETLKTAPAPAQPSEPPPPPPPQSPAPAATRPTPTFAPFALTFALPPQERLTEKPWQPVDPGQTYTGLGPSAAKIYFSKDNVTWGMSADFFSFVDRRGLDSSGEPNVDRTNVAALSPTLATRLHRRLLFNSQFLFENGGSESSNTVTLQKGQAVVLQAYIDWLGTEKMDYGLRIGHQLIPVGTVNTSQESLTYFGVLKPELEREIVPSTWHENGVSFWVRRPQAEFQIGIFNSLNAEGFRGSSFLAGGRSHGQDAPADDLMGTARILLKWRLAELGASIAAGQSAQRTVAYRHGTFGVGEMHLRLKPSPRVEFFLQAAQGHLVDADSISVVNSTVMGEKARGASGHVAVNFWKRGEQSLWFYGRHSKFDLHDRVPGGMARDNSLNKTQSTLGFSYLPLPNCVVSVDYAFKKSSARDEEDELNLGASISF